MDVPVQLFGTLPGTGQPAKLPGLFYQQVRRFSGTQRQPALRSLVPRFPGKKGFAFEQCAACNVHGCVCTLYGQVNELLLLRFARKNSYERKQPFQ